MSFTLRLPVPPSVNALYRNLPGEGRVKSKAYRRWIKDADSYFLLQKRGLTPVTGKYVMQINLPAESRLDVSSAIKAAEDYCVSRGLTPDDSQSQGVSILRVEGLTGEIEITATAVGD